MAHKLSDLTDHLFAQLDRLANENLTPDQLALEVQRSEAMCDLSSQVTGAATLQLKAAALFAEHGGKVLPMLPQVGQAVPKGSPKADDE